MGALISGNLTSPNCVSVKLPVVQEDIRSKDISHPFQLLPAKRATPDYRQDPSSKITLQYQWSKRMDKKDNVNLTSIMVFDFLQSSISGSKKKYPEYRAWAWAFY
jgi:hypothetical protein